ncbi:MAG: lipase, partial [Gammaproteobacteria bacterium]|nr:lipase [Gammaproteobacteria bacterium]
MNKLLVSLAVASALGLAGCGDSLNDLKNDAVSNDTVLVPMSRVVFDPTAGIVSVPNDLLFQGTTDGTLVLPGEAAAVPNYADPQTALGALDGWSTQNPFAIELAFAGGVSLDAASASRPDSVRIVEVLMGDPSSPDAACKAVPRGVACKAVGQLTFGQDFVTKASGNSVAVIPLKPLKAATTYIVVLTNNLKDSEGRSIAPSTTYELVKQDLATLPLGSDAQRALQGVINSFENAVSTQSIAKDTIIYTAAVTTQSTTNVLSTVKQLMLPSALNNNTPPSIAVSDSGL